MTRGHARGQADTYGYYWTSAWWRRRERIRRRARGICEYCLLRPMAHVHHRTYTHFGQERSRELMAVCQPCHRYIHGRATRCLGDPASLLCQGDSGMGCSKRWLAYLRTAMRTQRRTA